MHIKKNGLKSRDMSVNRGIIKVFVYFLSGRVERKAIKGKMTTITL